MVVMGAIIGGILFYTQVCAVWDVSKVSAISLFGATLLNALLIPAPGTEVRGLGEMFPLISWSLFFEYIGSILYALIIRRFSTKALLALVIAGLGLGAFAIFEPYGESCRILIDRNRIYYRIFEIYVFIFCRTASFPCFKPLKIKGAFWICGIILVTFWLSLV